MKPANCLLCGKPSLDEIAPARGNWVQFLDYQAPDEFHIGHPAGLEYVCDEHLEAARLLESRTSKDALAELQKQFGCLPPYQTKNIPEPRLSLWRRLFPGVMAR